MAHYIKDTTQLVLRPGEELVKHLKEAAAKVKHRSHNQMAVELIEAALHMVLDTKPNPSIPANVVTFRAMLGKPTIHAKTPEQIELEREGENLKAMAEMFDAIRAMDARMKNLESKKKIKQKG